MIKKFAVILALLPFIASADWTVKIEHQTIIKNNSTGEYPPNYETNYVVCVSVLEPNTNIWQIEYTWPTNSDATLTTNGLNMDYLYWSHCGTVTGNQAQCFFTSENAGGPNWSFPSTQFYRAKLVQ